MKSNLIKQKAIDLGFAQCGIAKAEILQTHQHIFTQWLANKNHGEMSFLERNTIARYNPALLVNNAKSVVAVVLPYFPPKTQTTSPKISKYALGSDYHELIIKKLDEFIQFINQQFPEADSRAFCDSAPVAEKIWAQNAGLGFIGKNTLLISPEFGSYILLGIIITNIELEYDSPNTHNCGNCNLCVEACPTKALQPKAQIGLIAHKCISYLTIEKKGEIPTEFHPAIKKADYLFGCDICQDVCPHNKKVKTPENYQFEFNSALISMDKKQWEKISELEYKNLFKKSSLKRLKYNKMKHILDVLNS